MKRNVVLFLLIFILAACSAVQAGVATPESKPTKPSGVDMGDALIIYVKSGGFAGIHEEWRWSYGSLTAPDGEVYATTAETTDALLAQLKDKGFFDMPDNPGRISPCRDCFNYSVTAVLDGQVKTVSADDVTMSDIPGFGDVVAILEEIVTSQK
jgi:hypothetical protein